MGAKSMRNAGKNSKAFATEGTEATEVPRKRQRATANSGVTLLGLEGLHSSSYSEH